MSWFEGRGILYYSLHVCVKNLKWATLITAWVWAGKHVKLGGAVKVYFQTPFDFWNFLLSHQDYEANLLSVPSDFLRMLSQENIILLQVSPCRIGKT